MRSIRRTFLHQCDRRSIHNPIRSVQDGKKAINSAIKLMAPSTQRLPRSSCSRDLIPDEPEGAASAASTTETAAREPGAPNRQKTRSIRLSQRSPNEPA